MGEIVLDGIRKRFGEVEVLKGVSLRISEGEFVTLLGPSGCGKSTLLRIIAGLERQSDGRVEIAGRVVDEVAAKDRNIAMVFQSYALYPHMTVRENIALPLDMRRLSRWQRLPGIGRLVPGARATRRAIAADVLHTAASLEIDPLLERRPSQLSGGQKQRVALGRALVRDPTAFLLDEPLSNLDAKLRVQMRAELTDLHRRLRATMVYVTHDQAEAMTMSDRVAVMIAGELLQVAPPRRLYEDPDNLTVAEFVGSPKINALPGRVVTPGRVACLGATVAAPDAAAPGTAVVLGVRPEAIQLGPAGAPGTIPGRVRHVEHLGPETMVHAAVDGLETPVLARLDPIVGGAVAFEDRVGLRLPPERVLMFDGAGQRLRPAAERMTARG